MDNVCELREAKGEKVREVLNKRSVFTSPERIISYRRNWRFRTQQFFLSEICGEMFYPNL